MKKIKVLQLLRSPQGGIRKHVLEIIDNLDQNRFESILITNTKDGDTQFNKREKNEYKVIDYPIIDQPGLSDLVALYKLFKIIKNLDVDIIHGHGAKGGLYARIIGKILKKKVLYTAHGGSLHSMHGKIKNIVYQVVEKVLYYLTDKVVFESKYSQNEYCRKINKNKTKYILNYNAIVLRLPEEVKPIRSESIKIGAFGLLRKIKGHDILIEAASNLINQGYKLEVNIYGEGEERHNLQELIERRKCTEWIKIREYCENIQNEMNQCEIVVHPSRFESFGYVPIEALNEGITVVSSLEGGLSEVMDEGRNGFCPKILTIKELELAILNAIEDEAGRILKYNHAKKQLEEKFNFTNFVRNIEEIYTKCLH